MSTKGFTLIETLVAIAILTLSVAGPLLIASRALISAQIAQEQLTASYLAQEGVEYVRLMRDDAYLTEYHNSLTSPSINATSAGWSDFTTGSGSTAITQCVSTSVSKTCTLDPMSSTPVQPCGSGLNPACTPLYVTSNGLYTQTATGGTKMPYVRTIQAKPATASPSTEEIIVSTVTWSFHNHLYSVSVDDHLTAWQ